MFITKQKSSRNQHMTVTRFYSNYDNIESKLGSPDKVETYKNGRLKQVTWNRNILGTRFDIRIEDFNYIHSLTKKKKVDKFNVNDFPPINEVDDIEVFLVGDNRKAELILPLLSHYFNDRPIGAKAYKIVRYIFEDYMDGEF